LSKYVIMRVYAGAVAAVTVYSAAKHVKKQTRPLLTQLLNATAERPELSPRIQRQKFNQQPLAIPREHKNHSHRKAAACRNAGPHFAKDLARNLGCEPFSHQMSSSDSKSGTKGTRDYFWMKDVHIAPQRDTPGPHDLHFAIDVDYYMNMPTELCENFAPWCLYTLMPMAAGECTEDFSMCFNEDNEVIYKVSGGGSFRHPLWNYNSDSVTVTKYFWGIPTSTAVYLIDRRSVDTHHCLVSLTPVRRWNNVFTAALSRYLHGHELERFCPVDKGYVRLDVQTQSGLKVSIAKVNSQHSVTIPFKYFSALDNINTHNKLSLGNCVSMIGDVKQHDLSLIDSKRVDASVLYDYFLSAGVTSPTDVSAVDNGVMTYDFDIFGPESKPTLISFMKPIVDGAYAPAQSAANLKRAVDGRIRSIQHKEKLKPTTKQCQIMQEFIDHMANDIFTMRGKHLSPCGLDEVMRRQSRPSQQKLIEDAFKNNDQPQLGSFIKKEAYAGPKDPRIITVDQPRHKVEYAQYIYPVMDALKLAIPSYMPGKDPNTVAHWIAEMCAEAETMCISDMVRMDGTISSFCREAWGKLLLAVFPPEERVNLLNLYTDSYDKTVHLTIHATNTELFSQKEKYGSKYAILSGMIDTSCFGTFVTLSALYMGLRTTKKNGVFYSPEQAWKHVTTRTAACGDDLDTVDVDAATMRRGASIIGCRSDAYNVERGHLGVVFLSRAYGRNVWSGCPNSMTCLKRQLAKFHTTVHLQGVTEADKLKEKARSFLMTDRHTPVLGEICQAVERICGPLHRSAATKQIERYQSDLPNDVQYPNWREDWMEELAVDELPHFDFISFTKYVDEADSLDMLLDLPAFNQETVPKVKTAPVNIKGDVFGPEEEQVEQTKATVTRRGGRARKKAVPPQTELRIAAPMMSPGRGHHGVAKPELNRVIDSKSQKDKVRGSTPYDLASLQKGIPSRPSIRRGGRGRKTSNRTSAQSAAFKNWKLVPFFQRDGHAQLMTPTRSS